MVELQQNCGSLLVPARTERGKLMCETIKYIYSLKETSVTTEGKNVDYSAKWSVLSLEYDENRAK